MEAIFKEYLLEKRYLVHNSAFPTDQADDVVLALMTLFAIRVKDGFSLADTEMIADCSRMLGVQVPIPFYRGFPQSVRALTPDALLFDQLVHYAVTYGFGNFDEAGHSILEKYLERVAFEEEVTVTDYTIVDEERGMEIVKAAVSDLLASSRPLNEASFEIVKAYVKLCGLPGAIASKNTAIRLLIELSDLSFSAFLTLSDVMKVVAEIQYREYGSTELNCLNLKNRDRKLITALLDEILENGIVNIRECFEKKALWCGLLHHIHYKPKSENGKRFVQAMRQKGNESVYAEFERAMIQGEVQKAAVILKNGKGSGAVLRNLHYLLSRAKTADDIRCILSMVETDNVMILLQLYVRYRTYVNEISRTFRFTRFNKLIVYRENEKDSRRRKTILSEDTVSALEEFIGSHLKKLLKNRVGRVYLDKAMKNIALPIQESTTQGGYGVLPRGSRLAIPEGNKLRAFVYWEKVNDIDLSAIGLDGKGGQHEFSWRTMWGEALEAIVFSGDETSGYEGGSEFYDVDLTKFRQLYPSIEKLIFSANVYSGPHFCECLCRAGYMIRENDDSGEIYEPKTVRSAFTVNADSTMTYLFGVDLKTREFVWLNTAKESEEIVAGRESFDHLIPYFGMAEAMSLYSFFEMMAQEIVDDSEMADIVVSDAELPLKEGALQIRSYEYEKIFPYMN